MKNVLTKPIIFFGIPRSGTTIIAETILAHDTLAWPSNYSDRFPKIVHLNMLRRLFQNKWFYLKGNKHQLYKTNFLNKYTFKADESYPMWDHLVGTSFSRGTIEREATLAEKKSVRDYFTMLVKKQGKQRLAFKITGPSRIMFLQSIFPDACFIRVKREIIPTINSLMNVEFWKAGGAKKIWWDGLENLKDKNKIEKLKKSSLQLTAYQVHQLNRLTDKELKDTPASFIELEYENFLSDPNVEIKKICDFCDLSYSEKIKSFLVDNPLVNRNKKNHEYFTQSELNLIAESDL